MFVLLMFVYGHLTDKKNLSEWQPTYDFFLTIQTLLI